MRALFSFAQTETGATLDHFNLVQNPVTQELLQGQSAWNRVNKCQHVGAKVVLELCVFEQLVQDNLSHSITLKFNDQTHTCS